MLVYDNAPMGHPQSKSANFSQTEQFWITEGAENGQKLCKTAILGISDKEICIYIFIVPNNDQNVLR